MTCRQHFTLQIGVITLLVFWPNKPSGITKQSKERNNEGTRKPSNGGQKFQNLLKCIKWRFQTVKIKSPTSHLDGYDKAEVDRQITHLN